MAKLLLSPRLVDFLDHSSLAAIACTERMAAELARPLLRPLKPRWFLAFHGYGADRENTRRDKFGFDDDEVGLCRLNQVDP